jgi:hypothetical protein
MFETLMVRMARIAERRAAARAEEVAARLREELPGGVTAERVEGGVRLSGRALRRRPAIDQAIKWTIAGLGR